MGIEFRESLFLLSPKSDKPLAAGMVFNVILGFQNLVIADSEKNKDPRARVYSLLLADTVLVGAGDSATVLTDAAPSAAKEISYFFKDKDDDDDEDEVKAVSSKAAAKELAARPERKVTRNSGVILKSKLRNEGAGDEVTADQRRREHQQQLAQQVQAAGAARFAAKGDGDDSATGGKAAQARIVRKFESYKKEGQLPREVKECRIVVDRRAETVVLPIHGLAVPFHIATVKNVSKNDEGEYTYLRFNFVTPGQVGGVKKDDKVRRDKENRGRSC